MNLQFLKNTDPRFMPSEKEVEEKVEELLWLDLVDQEKIWEQLKLAFSDTEDHSEILQWRALWMVYTKFSWTFLRSKDKDFFEKTIIKKQLPMAALLGIDLLDQIFHYLDVRSIDQEDMSAFYSRIKRAFLSSRAVLGQLEGKKFTIYDLVNKEKYLNSVPDNSMEEAKFRDDLQRMLFPKEENFLKGYFIYDDKDLAITGLLNLTDFFLSVEPDKIWYVVDAYVHPEKYEVVEQTESNEEGMENKEKTLELPDTSKLNTKPQEQKPTYKEIASRIENEHVRDTEGNFVDLDSVFSELAELSEKYNDPKIAELYYFDEDTGVFKWNL